MLLTEKVKSGFVSPKTLPHKVKGSRCLVTVASSQTGQEEEMENSLESALFYTTEEPSFGNVVPQASLPALLRHGEHWEETWGTC